LPCLTSCPIQRHSDRHDPNNIQSKKFIDKARELGVNESDDPLNCILKRIVRPMLEKKEAPEE